MIIIRYDRAVFQKLKKVNVRVRKHFNSQLRAFEKNPNDPHLNNHSLEREYKDCYSINITADYRAIYTIV
jgi:mRNA-degrading endonuclease RelE of RelBE toxin-antitoxin system